MSGFPVLIELKNRKLINNLEKAPGKKYRVLK